MHALWEPWTQGFMQRALLELVLLGVVGGVLGCWVALYELSYSAESLAHALFPGLVGAALLGVPLLLGGAVGVLGAATAVALAGRAPEIGRDTAVGIVITTLFGLGVLLALSQAAPPGLGQLLFGDLLGVSRKDVIVSATLAGLVVGALALLHRQLLVVGFDRSTSRALGAHPLLVDLALLGLVAVTVVIGVQALGNLLVIAIVIGPAAIAALLGGRLATMMAAGAAIAIGCALAGLYLSYYANTAAGASVAAVTVGLYLLVRLGASIRRSPPGLA